jgi:multiple sugar transport system permease protein
MKSLGMINTHGALIMPYIAWEIPLSLWVLLSYFSKVPLDLDEAALVDGAGRLLILRKIIVPLAAPGIVSAALLVFIFSFNEFLFALMLTVDHHARTLPVGIALFEGLHGQIPWGYLMAASSLASLPLVLLAVAFQRRIVQGLTAGAVKN